MPSLTMNAIITRTRYQRGAHSGAPARPGKPDWQITGWRAETHPHFPAHLYGRIEGQTTNLKLLKRQSYGCTRGELRCQHVLDVGDSTSD
jgi:hypothetical protein